MKYKNLLVNTAFDNYQKSWVVKNGTLKKQGKSLIIQSTSRLFGITQDFLIFNSTRLYFGLKVKIKRPVSKISVGIKCGTELHICEYKSLITNKWQVLSVMADIDVDTFDLTKYSVYLLSEALYNASEIEIKEPMLFDAKATGHYYSLKSSLDEIPYIDGITYKREINNCIFSGHSFVGKYWGVKKQPVDDILWDGKNGLTFTISREGSVYQQLPLFNGHQYLIKIAYERINGKGDCRLFVNDRGFKFDSVASGQVIVKFEAKPDNSIKLIFTNVDGVVPMVCYIRDIMMIDLTVQGLTKLKDDDIQRLPYLAR